MSSKKKQGPSTDKTEKKKLPFINLGKPKGPPSQNVNKNATGKISDTTDTGVIAAKLHSKEADKPSTANTGKIKKIAKFFKKATNVKTSKKVDAVIDYQQQNKMSRNNPTSTQEPHLTEEKIEKTGDEVAVATTSNIDGDSQMEKAATKIQAVFRGRSQRRSYLQKRQNIIKTEALARGFLARKQIASMKATPEVTDNAEEKSANLSAGKAESENLITLS